MGHVTCHLADIERAAAGPVTIDPLRKSGKSAGWQHSFRCGSSLTPWSRAAEIMTL